MGSMDKGLIDTEKEIDMEAIMKQIRTDISQRRIPLDHVEFDDVQNDSIVSFATEDSTRSFQVKLEQLQEFFDLDSVNLHSSKKSVNVKVKNKLKKYLKKALQPILRRQSEVNLLSEELFSEVLSFMNLQSERIKQLESKVNNLEKDR